MKKLSIIIISTFIILTTILTITNTSIAAPDAKGRWVFRFAEPCPSNEDELIYWYRCEPHILIQCTGLWSWYIVSTCSED